MRRAQRSGSLGVPAPRPDRPVLRRARSRAAEFRPNCSRQTTNARPILPFRPPGLRSADAGLSRRCRGARPAAADADRRAFDLERVPEPLQFENQRGALRSRFAAAGLVDRASLASVAMEARDSRLMATPVRQQRRDEFFAAGVTTACAAERTGPWPCERAQRSPRVDRTRSPCPRRAPWPYSAPPARSADAI